MVRDFQLATSSLTLAVRDYGGNGRPVVLVHGGPGLNLAIWDEFAPLLTGTCRVVAYDQRCSGRSDEGDCAFSAFVGDLHDVVIGLRLQRPVIVGQSWGGWIALSYAARWSEASGIVAADGPITYKLHPLGEAEWLELEEWASNSPIYNFSGTDAELDKLLADLRRSCGYDRFDEAVARRNMRNEGTQLKSRWTPTEWLHFDRVAFAEAIETLDPDQVYPRIRCPVLLVGATEGEQAVSGRPFSRASVEELQARHPAVQAAWLPSGHALPLDAPQAFADAVLNFVSAIDA